MLTKFNQQPRNCLDKEVPVALEKDQRIFIENKVKELGDMKSVKQLYHKDCSVDNYAILVAQKMFKEINNAN